MILESDLKEISPDVFEIDQRSYPHMRVPARVYTSLEMLRSIIEDNSLNQLVNVASLPGVHKYVLGMPDIHQGYGFPVGGVAALRVRDGVISPGGIGYDINCGVRLLTSSNILSEVQAEIKNLAHQIQRDVPSGTGRGGDLKLDASELRKVLNTGLEWAVQRGYASEKDRAFVESRGFYSGADAAFVSDEAKTRGSDQLGTIGAGNHFVEIQRVAQILDQEVAQKFSLFPDQVCVMIHTGSRGLGHQTCTDYVRQMVARLSHYGLTLPDRELAAAPFASEDGQNYFKAMACAANFAWTNRQLITFHIRNAWRKIVGRSELELLYDVSHNIAKIEEYGGESCVLHRKGATRAFGPGHPELPDRYSETGQPVIIPGSMGTASYVLAGTEGSMLHTFGSCCHGAGRRLSRMRAKKTIDYNKLRKGLEDQGIVVCAGSARGLLEEAPEAYKDVDQVIDVVRKTGIGRPVAKLVPLAVIKG